MMKRSTDKIDSILSRAREVLRTPDRISKADELLIDVNLEILKSLENLNDNMLSRDPAVKRDLMMRSVAPGADGAITHFQLSGTGLWFELSDYNYEDIPGDGNLSKPYSTRTNFMISFDNGPYIWVFNRVMYDRPFSNFKLKYRACSPGAFFLHVFILNGMRMPSPVQDRFINYDSGATQCTPYARVDDYYHQYITKKFDTYEDQVKAQIDNLDTGTYTPFPTSFIVNRRFVGFIVSGTVSKVWTIRHGASLAHMAKLASGAYSFSGSIYYPEPYFGIGKDKVQVDITGVAGACYLTSLYIEE